MVKCSERKDGHGVLGHVFVAHISFGIVGRESVGRGLSPARLDAASVLGR